MSPESNDAAAPGVEALVIRALELLESGAHDELERLYAAHPAQASTVRRRVALLGELGVLGTASAPAQAERLGEFELLEQLGAGGMGVVYRARQARLNREVALKIVRPEFLYFPETRERFQREVETVARLQHPGIVPVYSVGEERGVPFFTMELVVGASLEKILARVRGRDPRTLTGADLAPDPERAGWLFAGSWEDACLRVARQVCEALGHAHERGVVHRDLKPSNVMLTAGETSRVLLLDFGLASLAGSGKLTRTGSQLGTLDYMSPEQVRGDAAALGPRSDVYSLGATLYELLTLAKPFEGASLSAAAIAIERGELVAPRARQPGLSWEAETIVLTALDRDPARRYASAAAFGRDLENALERRPLDARRMGPWLTARRWVERNPMRAVAVSLAGLLAVGGPLAWAWQEQRASRDLAAERDVAQANYEIGRAHV
jgi:serine/threonine protein kinase